MEIHTDFEGQMAYGDYLRLDTILQCQTPVSQSHDEMLFIVIHQTSELWLKLILHELEAATESIGRGELQPAFKMLARVCRAQEQLIQSWDVLSTLTPADYMRFRSGLGRASGFQSYQYRLVEFALGARDATTLSVHRHRPDIHQRLEGALRAPSLYDVVLRHLAGQGFAIDTAVLGREPSLPHREDPSVTAAWLAVYRNVDRHWELYELGEKLLDIEDRQQKWRFHHVLTVERIIGMKPGTGGSAGVPYLRGRLAHRFFPELWAVRTEL